MHDTRLAGQVRAIVKSGGKSRIGNLNFHIIYGILTDIQELGYKYIITMLKEPWCPGLTGSN